MTFGQQYFMVFGLFMAACCVINCLWHWRAKRRRRNRYVKGFLPDPPRDPRNWSRTFMDSLR
jgi:hypothetical protein